MKAYVFREADIFNLLSSCLTEDYKKKFFVDTIQSYGVSLTGWLQCLLSMYVIAYQELTDASIGVTDYNRIYDAFDPLRVFMNKISHEYNPELTIHYAYPIDTVVSHHSDVTDGFSAHMYDDIYQMIEESLGLNPEWNDYQTCELPQVDVIEKLESFVEVAKFLVTSIDQIILPYRQPEVGVGVVFTTVRDCLVVYVDD